METFMEILGKIGKNFHKTFKYFGMHQGELEKKNW